MFGKEKLVEYCHEQIAYAFEFNLHSYVFVAFKL